MTSEFKLHKRHERAIERITQNGPLRRQVSATEEGALGGGFVFWIDRDGKRVPPATARDLIEHGILSPMADGLFDARTSQSFEVKR